MAEGKTNIFGKTYNTIGSADSNFIIKTKGDLKVLWGNKYIDVIKNGKIASEGSKILFIVNSTEEIEKNGIYIVIAPEGNELWVCIDGIKIRVANDSGNVTYVSFLVEQKANIKLKHTALTNIGFYYETLNEAKFADITSGIIYAEDTEKLYIAKNGVLTEYGIGNQNSTSDNSLTELLKKHPLYIEEYSLWVDGLEYIKCSGQIILLLMPVTVYSMFLSYGASENDGYRLYIENRQSILEIDIVKQRLYPESITHSQLEALINNNGLLPKKYYNIIDFLNPWEVTWENEPFFYEDLYEEINGVLHLRGKRNAMQLIVKARNSSELELLAWSPANPDWIIHYDPSFKGPEHKVVEDGKEVTYYGYRTKEYEIKDENGNIIEKQFIYLPCKGIITYLKDEFGNEGNFNFRLIMFKNAFKNWRHIVDKKGGTGDYFGEFDGSNNKFYIDALLTKILIFAFEQLSDSLGNTIGYNIKEIESEISITEGHYLSILGCILVVGNTFEFKYVNLPIIHSFSANIINNNLFLKINQSITCTTSINNNIFDDILGTISIKGLECNDNILRKINESVYIREGTTFNKNILTNFTKWINNTKMFVGNVINLCTGTLSNSNIMTNNTISSITGTLTNTLSMDNNLFNTVFNLDNKGVFKNNKIESIINSVSNNNTITNNNIVSINTLTNNILGSIINNNITNIVNLTNNNNISNNTFITIEYMSNSGTLTNNIINYIKSLNNLGVIDGNTIVNINESLTNGSNGNMLNNSILSINKALSNNFKFLNNNIDTINGLTIGANIQNNNFISIQQSNVNKDVVENSGADVIECYFNGECYNNIFRDTVTKCNFGIFSDNKIYKDLNECVFNGGNVSSCIFNKSVTKLTIANTVYGCTYNYINNLRLDKPVYYTTFHGNIGNISRTLTDYEWELLADPSKKTDVYPNIRVVCVPEIILPGMILMWYGSNTIPDGWALCDGNNGTPNLVGSFVKGDSVNATEPTTPEGINDKNEFTLSEDNLPKHSHPHKSHTHNINDISGTTEASTVDVSSSSYYGCNDSTVSVSSGVEGAESVDVVLDITYRTVNGLNTGSHTHSITISGASTKGSTSKETAKTWKNLPIKIEPKHFKIIFIMKIDENRL